MFCCLQATAGGSAAQQSGKKSGQQDKTKQEKVKKRLQELEGALIGGEKAGMADFYLWKVAIQSSSLGSRLTSLFFFFFLFDRAHFNICCWSCLKRAHYCFVS